jgi:hypothetical protein
MKPIKLNKYSATGILLLALAAVFSSIAFIADLPDITKAAFVISSMVCGMTGIFALTFSSGEPVDPWLVGILPAQGSLSLSMITKHLGMKGNAYFLPPRVTGEIRVMQFNPTSSYNGIQGSAPGSFRKEGPPGIVTAPSCSLLIEELKKKHAQVIPDKEEELSVLLGETIEDLFKFAPRVSVRWGENRVTITFHNYPYSDGCKVLEKKSRDCCVMSPCPACSLCGALIAEGKERVVMLERCSVSPTSQDVSAVFSLLPVPDSNP